MKNLFVGLRVRILYSHLWPELAGQEGRIIRAGTFADDCLVTDRAGKPCWIVHPDSWPYPTVDTDRGLRSFGVIEDQVEPILPEGMQPASWEDTVWDPERLVEESKELMCIE